MVSMLYKYRCYPETFHSLGFPSRESDFAHSLIIFLCILPAGLFGTASTNLTPPVKYLYFATLSFIHACISSAVVA